MKYILFFIFSIFSLSAFAQCESEICKTIEKLQNTNKEYKTEIAKLNTYISRLSRENRRLKSENENLKKLLKAQKEYIDKLENIIKQNEQLYKQKIDSLNFYRLKFKELDKQVISQSDTIKANFKEIEILRRDSIERGQMYEQFKKVNFFFDDNYIVPFNLPVAPIDYDEGGILDPKRELNDFLTRLSLLNNCDKIIVVVKINGNVKNKTKIENQIKRQIEVRYNIKCNVQYEFVNEDKRQIHFIIQSRPQVRP